IKHWNAEQGDDPDLAEQAGKIDLVFLDVPCSGSGSWRRQPDAKWQLTPERLAEFVKLQASILERGARLAKPGGRLAYVTCSVFAEENDEQVSAFLARHSEFQSISAPTLAEVQMLKGPAARPLKLEIPLEDESAFFDSAPGAASLGHGSLTPERA